jgi:ribosomal protein S18 acetylase RimI-like enzyme
MVKPLFKVKEMSIDKEIILRSPDQNNLLLRSINEGDIEQLRKWKNDHREYFFHKDIITVEQQKKWFSKFATNLNDFMFLINYNGEDIGCMGFRMLDDKADIYNVILGKKAYTRRGIMSASFRMMIEYIMSRYTENISAKVLLTNPAVRWYKKNGFWIESSYSDYHLMRLVQL